MMQRSVFPFIFFTFGSLFIDTLFRPEVSFFDHVVFLLYVFVLWSVLLATQSFLYKLINLCSKFIADIFNFSLSTLFFLFFLLDPIVFVSQGVHLYDRVVIDTLKNPNWNHELQLGVAPFVMVGLALLSFHLLNYFFNRFVAKKISRLFYPSIVLKVWGFTLSLSAIFFFFSYPTIDTTSLPFFSFLQGKIKQRSLDINYSPNLSALTVRDDVV